LADTERLFNIGGKNPQKSANRFNIQRTSPKGGVKLSLPRKPNRRTAGTWKVARGDLADVVGGEGGFLIGDTVLVGEEIPVSVVENLRAVDKGPQTPRNSKNLHPGGVRESQTPLRRRTFRSAGGNARLSTPPLSEGTNQNKR